MTQLALFFPVLDQFLASAGPSGAVPAPPAPLSVEALQSPSAPKTPKGKKSAQRSNNSSSLSLAEEVAATPEQSATASKRKILLTLVIPFAVRTFLEQVRQVAAPPASSTTATTATEGRLSAVVPLPPYRSDSEFLQGCEMRFMLESWHREASALQFHQSWKDQWKDLQLSLNECAACVQKVIGLYEIHHNHRLAGMTLAPRIRRVATALNMSDAELNALLYLQVMHSGSSFAFTVSHSLMPATVAKFGRLTPQELLHFLADHRDHMKQGLVIFETGRGSMMDAKVHIPQEAVSAFTGEDLTDEQLIKLEKTALASVLHSERGSMTALPPPAVAAKRPREVSEEDDDEDDAEDSVCSGGDGGAESAGSDSELDEEEASALQTKLKELVTLSTAAGIKLPALQPSVKKAKKEVTSEQQSPIVGAFLTPQNSPASPNADSVRSSSALPPTTPTTTSAVTVGTGSKMSEPYTTDIDYIDDAFRLLANMIKIRNAEGDMKDDVEDTFYNIPKTKMEATIRELKGKHRVQSVVHKSRIEATKQSPSKWLPRIEAVAARLQLSEMEKQILLLLVGNVISHDILIAINGRYVMREGQRELSVGYMLFVLCEGLKERVSSRKYFYQNAPLIANGLISVSLSTSGRSCFNTDLTEYCVDIDRKIVDYLMGTETATSEMVPGSKLYTPSVPLDNVVLPVATKNLVLSTIEHYALFEACKKKSGFGDGLGTNGSGLVFLFYGPSGTGKTMLANAVAHDLGKKLLLVNLLQFKSDAKSPDVLRFVFREAKLNDAVIFFDECESFFETRESNPLVTAILAEFEKYDGMIILATNRAQIIDEAMNRRISLMVEFKLPDHQLRERIWRAHIPKSLVLDENVSFEALALDYELTGGLIRNAMLAAISCAVAREKNDHPTMQMDDFINGAKQQLRGFFQAAERPGTGSSELYLTPKRSLAELMLDPSAKKQLEAVAKLTKSRHTLFSQWGFEEHDCADQGVLYFFHGPSGTGKSLAVEGIAYECGATVRICNVQELLLTKELNIQQIFDEARKLGALVVFDHAQVLFDYSDRSVQLSQLIQYHAVTYPRPVIVVATTGGASGVSGNTNTVDSRASKLQFTEEIAFAMPNRTLRKELWRKSLPEKVPISEDVDFHILSEPVLTAKLIRSICFSACCKVALRPLTERILTMQMLIDEKQEMLLRERRRSTHSNMFA